MTPWTPAPDLVSWPSITASEPAATSPLTAVADSSHGPATADGDDDAVGDAEAGADGAELAEFEPAGAGVVCPGEGVEWPVADPVW